MSPKPIEFHYLFEKPRDEKHPGEATEEKYKFHVSLDPKTLSYLPPKDPSQHSSPPSWAQLGNHQCQDCPLNAEKSPHCPIARNLAHLIEAFAGKRSYSKMNLLVRTQERSYLRKGALQEGLFSIFGIIMATSDCPEMNFLKPMAKFHLPFATPEETVLRSVSFFLLGQFFQGQKGSFDLAPLEENYRRVERVNEGILNRIHGLIEDQNQKGDADQNALVILNAFAQILSIEINRKMSSLEPLFKQSRST